MLGVRYEHSQEAWYEKRVADLELELEEAIINGRDALDEMAVNHGIALRQRDEAHAGALADACEKRELLVKQTHDLEQQLVDAGLTEKNTLIDGFGSFAEHLCEVIKDYREVRRCVSPAVCRVLLLLLLLRRLLLSGAENVIRRWTHPSVTTRSWYNRR